MFTYEADVKFCGVLYFEFIRIYQVYIIVKIVIVDSIGSLIDDLLFYVPLKNCYRDVTIAGEGLQTLGLCSALSAFEQGEFLSCHTCCDTVPQFFQSHLKARPAQLVASYHTQRGVEDLF
jgi:hypothetical protein